MKAPKDSSVLWESVFSHSLEPSPNFLCSQFECNYSKICVVLLASWKPCKHSFFFFFFFQALVLCDPTACLPLHPVHFWDLHCIIGLNCTEPQSSITLPLQKPEYPDELFSLCTADSLYLHLTVCGEAAPFLSPSIHSNAHLLLDFVLSKHIFL